jgi:hypothetical protein
MKEAVQAYQEAFDEDLVKRIKSETGGMFAKNYGKWIDRLVLFNRNEEKTCSYDKSQIDDFSDQLYNAGAGKTFGCNEDVFLEILNQANDATIELIVDAYKQYGDLQTDVEKKMGGDLEKAVVARITPRIDYLAIRVYQACKGFGTDEECIARILGCLTNHEVEKLVQRYNDIHRDCETPYNDFRTLMQSELSGDFLTAILIMLDGTSPKGHYRLKETYPEIANIECEKFQNVVLNDYNETLAISEGKSPMTGPLQFIGIHPLNMFQSRDMDDNYTPAFPYVEPTVDEILFRSVDGLVSGDENEGATEEKQALINSLNDAITQQESEIEKYKNLTPSLKVQYDNICKDFKYLDVLIGQYQNDCLEMKSFCSKHGIEIAD